MRIGWQIKRESGSHKILSRPGWADVVFAFHDRDEIGPKDAGPDFQEYWSEAR
jgi:predicted RNA binding protein YcfA (HicA-like mRNA interferase family)